MAKTAEEERQQTFLWKIGSELQIQAGSMSAAGDTVDDIQKEIGVTLRKYAEKHPEVVLFRTSKGDRGTPFEVSHAGAEKLAAPGDMFDRPAEA